MDNTTTRADEIIERQGQMIVKQAEENAELRAEIERLKGVDQKGT